MRVFSPLRAALFLPAAVTRHQATNLPVRMDYKHLTLQARQVQCCQQVPRLTADKTAGDGARVSHTAPVWRTAAASGRESPTPEEIVEEQLLNVTGAGTSEEPGPRRPGEAALR